VIETRRSHTLGRVYWGGVPQPDSGQPEGDPLRVLRAPVNGQLVGVAQIGDRLDKGEIIAKIRSPLNNQQIKIVSPFKGVLRGLIHPGLQVTAGLKIGDVDLRDDPALCNLVSDKALAIGGSVLEAILSQKYFRNKLWN
jgi:xanthine dehydrogenase accessory factor